MRVERIFDMIIIPYIITLICNHSYNNFIIIFRQTVLNEIQHFYCTAFVING